MNGEQGAAVVVFPRELELQVERRRLAPDPVDEGTEFGVILGSQGILSQQFEPGLDLIPVGVQPFQGLAPAFESAAAAQQRRALPRLVPEARLLHLVIERR